MKTILKSLLLVSMSTLTVIVGNPVTANNDLTALRLQMACPNISHVRVDDEGTTYRVRREDSKKAKKCIAKVYANIAKDPYPVNMDGLKPGCLSKSYVRKSDGMIIIGAC